MALAYFSLTPRTVTGSGTAKAAVRYLVREGEYAPKEVAYLTRQAPASHDRTDLRHVEVGNLPAWAGGKAEVFFAKAEQHERVNGRYAYALTFALPRELTHDQQLAMTRDFVEATMHDKPYVWVKHEPVAYDGLPQPHVHILMSYRTVDGIERLPAQTFARWNAQHPERGGMQKDAWWRERGKATQLRMAYADVANYHLEQAGVEARIDPRTLKDRGIDREAHGKHTQGKNLDRDAAKEHAQAMASWEQRKAYKQLGNIHAISREEFVLLVRQWTREYERGTALPRVSPEQSLAWAERDRDQAHGALTRLEHQVHRAHAHVMLAEHRGRHPLAQATRGVALAEDPPAPGLEVLRPGRERRKDRGGYER